MNVRLGLLAAIVIAGLSHRAVAQWNTDSRVRNQVVAADSAQKYAAMCPDGRGGAFVAWEDARIDTIHMYIYAQRLDDRGNQLWNGRGLPLTTCMEDFQHKPKLCVDGAGGVIIGFYNDSGPRQIVAQRMDSTGKTLWGCAGLKINNTASSNELIAVVSDRRGGAYFVWTLNNYSTTPAPTYTIYVTRVDANGNPVWNTPTTVLNVQGNIYGGTGGTDTMGNVFVGWEGYVGATGTATFRVQKVTPAGVAAWPVGGVVPDANSPWAGVVTGDQAGGAFTATSNGNKGLSAIGHVRSAGTVAWSTKFCLNYLSFQPRIVVDGYGGAIAAVGTHVGGMSTEADHLYVQRVDANGTGRWGTDGVQVNDPDGYSVGVTAMVNDGAGGVIAAWQQSKLVSNLNATHLDSSGGLFWGSFGKVVCNGPATHIGLVAGRDYPQQMLCVWGDYRDTALRADVYATKLGDPWLHALDTTIDFGRVNVGDTVHIAKPACLRNIGVEDLVIASDKLVGPSVNDFAIDNDPSNVTLEYRSTRDLNVSFLPAAAGPKSADIVYTSNTKFASPTIHLVGRGVTPGIQVINRVDLGNVSVGQFRDSTVLRIVRSTGSGFLHVDSVVLMGSSRAFTLDSGNVTPIVLDSGLTLAFKIRFQPVMRGRAIDTFIVYSNTPNPSLIIVLGTGLQGSLKLFATDLNFGDVLVNNPADSIVNQFVRNTGTGAVRVTSMAFNGGNVTQFSVQQGNAPFTVGAAGSANVTLRFLPTTIGAKASSLELVTDGGDTLLFGVRGNGVQQKARKAVMTVLATSVNMGDTLVGSRTDSVLTAWIGNTGDTMLTVDRMSLVGQNASEFAVDDSLVPFTVDSGAAHSVTVHFLPTSVGTKTAQLTFTCNSATPPVVTLNGKAHLNQGRGVLTVASNRIDCGNSPVAVARMAVRSGFVHNTGNAALNVTGMTIAGVNAADFVVTTPKIFALNAGDSADVTVQFTPAAAGARSAALTVHTDIGDSSVVTLAGTGTQSKLSLAFAAIDFGKVPVGTNRDTSILAFITNSGTDTARVTQVTFAGADIAAFSNVGTALPITLAPLASAPIVLRFLPARTGIHTAEVELISATDTLRAALTGRGVTQMTLTIAGGRGTPGTVLTLPVTTDVSLSGTAVKSLDVQIVFTASQFYPTAIQTTGTATAAWTVTPSTLSGDTMTVHLSGAQPPAAGKDLFHVVGTILQSSVVKAPIALNYSKPTGDPDVAMATSATGEIVMDSLCGFGTHTFSVRTGPLMVWQPSPNPATSGVNVHYRLGDAGVVDVVVRDAQGRVFMDVSRAQSSGDHELAVDTRTLPAGVYVCTIRAGGEDVTRRFVVYR